MSLHACAQIEARSQRRGVIRSSLQPEETAGLTRSGDLSRMLPFEAHLLAAGWPRDRGSDGAPSLHSPLFQCDFSPSSTGVKESMTDANLCHTLLQQSFRQ